jgi:signal transduction histidine kinase/DNA-binding response OmpR family regulator
VVCVSNPVRILLIDDNPVDRARILRELEQSVPDLQTLEVSEESGFAKAMESSDFDLVLCDDALPWTNGLALLQTLKTRWPATPVVMVTGSDGEEIAIAAIKAGFDDYVLKSATHLARLPSAVRTALERARRTRQLEAVRTAMQEITRELDPATLPELISRRAVALVDATSGGVCLWDEAVQVVAPAAWFGDERLLTDGACRLGEGIAGTVAARRRGMVVNDYATSPYIPRAGPASTRATAVMAEPLVCGDKLLGVLAVASAEGGRRFAENDRQILGLFAAQAAVAMENARLFGEASQARQSSHSEKMTAMGRLISGVAHELNNPLTAIFGNAQLLMLGATDEVTRQRADVLVGEADRAAKIVRNLLAFARPYTPERRPLLLDQLIDEAVNLRKRDLSARKITVLHSRETAIPPVLADPGQVRQVLGNLLTNAEQALSGRGDGQIRIACRAEPGQDTVKVTISDNGPGIPAEVLGKVFDPFFTTKEAGQGTGLGLATCYAILREHGGQIRAGNCPEGGTWFEFELPGPAENISALPADRPSSGAGASPRERGAPRKRILVVDDEESIVRVVAGALKIVGHHVEVAKDGRAAADVLTRGEFDLVLLDMKMPGFDGERIYEDVIRRKATPPRVIIMTGDTVNTQTRRFLDRTGLRCVEKPFTLQDIWDCVRDDGGASTGNTR